MIPIKPVSGDSAGRMPAEPADAARAYLEPGLLQLSQLPPLSLYVHFPWCVRKCPYCDFNSHEVRGDIPEAAYLDALRADLEHALPLVWGRKIQTVFIGGGTPSLLTAAGLDRLLADIRMLLPLDGAAEITMEANPGTFEAERFASYRASGINRLSIGIQSFDGRFLERLGRIHDGDEACRAVEIARANFDNINLDLMYALPGQDMDDAARDLDRAIAFETSHLSLYHLTLEPNTYFASHPPELPDDDQSAAMQEMIEERTVAAGFRHYEVSAFAKPGRESRHNLNYWKFGDYLGIGAGAHSKLSFPHRIVRQMRFKQPKAYLSAMATGSAVQTEAEIGRHELGFEFMLNALRLTDGVEATLFGERTGLALTTIEQALDEGERKGLLFRDHRILRPTLLGRRFLNDLQQIFLAD